MDEIRIDPDRFAHFGSPEGASFCLVTNAKWQRHFAFVGETAYADRRILPFDAGDDFDALLKNDVPERAHVLVVAPSCYFRSPSPAALGPNRKLSVMACNSTPTPLDAVAHFLEMATRMDPAAQDAMAERFFDGAERAAELRFVDPVWGTEAVFAHRCDDVQWHEQVGALDWGGQQLFPAGEISVLPVSLYDDGVTGRLALDGTIALHGLPVLHSGSVSFLPSDQARLYEALVSLTDGAVVATVSGGEITGLDATNRAASPAARTLEDLMTVDSRYRVVVEIGFSVNTTLEPYPGNAAMNEVCGQEGGSVHWGIGLLPYTQYHLDVLSPGTRVTDEAGAPLFGAVPTTTPRRRILRRQAAACPCVEGG